VAYPPFYFGEGGVRALCAALSEHVRLQPARGNPGLLLVDPPAAGDDPLQRSLSTLGIPDALASDTANAADAAAPTPPDEAQPRGELEASAVGAFELLQGGDGAALASASLAASAQADPQVAATSATSPPPSPQPPLTPSEWESMLDSSGRLTDLHALRTRAFGGGVAPELRQFVWPFLLGLHPAGETARERAAARRERLREYRALRAQWQSIGPAQEARFAAFRERKTRIQKDVPRTDRRHPLFRAPDSEHSALMYRVLMSYMMWNFDLGYCQGMSDLLSPLIVVLAGAEGLPGGDSDACDAVEADCFWCFDRLMGMVGANFDQDQSGMHAQLLALARLLEALDPPLFQHLQRVSADNVFFAFRWVLCLFKRELRYEDVLRYWDALWSGRPDFLLFCCVAVLRWHKSTILDEALDFEEMLRLVQDLAGKIDVERMLQDARVLADSEQAAAIALPVMPPRALPPAGEA